MRPETGMNGTSDAEMRKASGRSNLNQPDRPGTYGEADRDKQISEKGSESQATGSRGETGSEKDFRGERTLASRRMWTRIGRAVSRRLEARRTRRCAMMRPHLPRRTSMRKRRAPRRKSQGARARTNVENVIKSSSADLVGSDGPFFYFRICVPYAVPRSPVRVKKRISLMLPSSLLSACFYCPRHLARALIFSFVPMAPR